MHCEAQILKGKQSYKEGIISPRWPEQQLQGRATWERESTWNLCGWGTVNPRWMEMCATGLATTTGCTVLPYKRVPHYPRMEYNKGLFIRGEITDTVLCRHGMECSSQGSHIHFMLFLSDMRPCSKWAGYWLKEFLHQF